MTWVRTVRGVALAAAGVVLAGLAAGCAGADRPKHAGKEPTWPPSRTFQKPAPFVAADVPRELQKVCLPDYRVEPPDILLIEAVRAIPRPPYRAEPLDVLYVELATGLPDQPLRGPFGVEPDGTINFGTLYGGSVQVRGKTIPEVRAALEAHFKEVVKLKDPIVTVALVQSRAGQRITGPHLVRPDGTISLGTYGNVRVAGLTVDEVRAAVEARLAEQLLDPQVSVDVGGYNSKLYYIILDGGGAGQSVYRLPVTGNDTVLDAVSQITGLSAISSTDRIWLSRPAPVGCQHQVLPVDWRAISELGDTATNYQLLPGDRIFVAANPWVATDIKLARVLAPIERIFGGILLGNGAVRSFKNNGSNGGFGGGF